MFVCDQVGIFKYVYEAVVADFVRGTAVGSNGSKKAIRIDKRGWKVRAERLR